MSDAAAPARQLRFAYFGHDSHETTIQKRIASLEYNGCKVVGFTFRREHQAERVSVPFENVALGVTADRNYLRRLPALAFGVFTALRHWRMLRSANVIQARNIDMLLVALAVKFMSGSRARVVYEVLDVQRAFVGDGITATTLRWVERRILPAVDVLLVSSPAFIPQYYAPIQKFDGQWHLLENKISGSQVRASASSFVRQVNRARPGPPWIIGWFGVLRCERSLRTLAEIADRLGPSVSIMMRGRLSREDITNEQLAEMTRGRPNMTFGGSYLSPEQLGEIYSRVHFSWSIDYTDDGKNSDWLLPNRIYEGGYFDVVALAREGTATGQLVDSRGLGRAFPEPLGAIVASFLAELDEAAYASMKKRVAANPRSLFVDETDTQKFLMRLRAKTWAKDNAPDPFHGPQRPSQRDRTRL